MKPIKKNPFSSSRIFDLCPDLIVVTHPETDMPWFFNPAWKTLLGYDPESLGSHNLYELIHPEDRQKTIDFVAELLEKRLSQWTIVNRYISKEGKIFWISWSGFEENGYLWTLGRDFTQIHLKDQLLIETQRDAKIGSWYLSSKDNRLEWSEGVYDIYGVSQAEPSTLELAISCYAEYERPRISQNLKDLLVKGEAFDSEFEFYDAKKQRKWVRAIGHPVYLDSKIVGARGTFQDVTDRVVAQLDAEQLKLESLHASKLASLGEMAASIGHEINNPLAIIRGYAEKLERLATESQLSMAELGRLAERILLGTERIETIIRSLRKLVGGGVSDQTNRVVWSEILEDTLGLCHEKFRTNGVEIKLETHDPQIRVTCVPGQISQVLLNLLNNAFDAVFGTPNAWIRIESGIKGEDLEIRVIDSGSGILQHHHDRLWVPFFTTKDVGKGTGLGLPISKRIVEAHGGDIWLDVGNRNTCFMIRLPINGKSPSTEQSPHNPS